MLCKGSAFDTHISASCAGDVPIQRGATACAVVQTHQSLMLIWPCAAAHCRLVALSRVVQGLLTAVQSFSNLITRAT